jgi:serine/threonine-protein kinase
MKRITLIFVLATCPLLVIGTIPSAAGQNDYWGALAYSYETGRYGFAYDYRTKDEATDSAVGHCGVDDCKAVVWFRNGCGAFAKGDNAFGWGIGDDKKDAQEKALAACREHGDGCRVIEWACTTR